MKAETISEKIKRVFGKDSLTKLRELLGTSEQKFKDAKLKDGTVIRYDGETPVKGAKIMCITADGEVACPDGDHVLETGETVSVKGGLIDAVKPAGEPEQEMATDSAKVAEQAKVEEVKKVIESIVKETVFSETKELKEKFASLEAANKKQGEELSAAKEVNKQLFALIEQIADLPSDEPADTPKGNKKDLLKDIKNDAMAFRKSVNQKG